MGVILRKREGSMDKDLIEEWLQSNTPKKCKSNEKGIKKSKVANAQSIDTRHTILEYRPNLTKKEIEEAKIKKQKLWANVKKKKSLLKSRTKP